MSDRASVRLLHVEDDPAVRERVRDVLDVEEEQFTVESEQEASEASDRLDRTAFDCVLSGHNLPGETGIELLESVREDWPALPFVLFTGSGSESVASAAISAGVTDYVQRDGSGDQYEALAHTIRGAIERADERRREHGRDDGERNAEPYEAIVENTEDGIYVFDSDANFEFVNERVVEASGIPRDAWLGEHVSIHTDLQTLTEDEVAAIESGVEAITAGEKGEVRVYLQPDVPGEIEDLELRLAELGTDDDRIVGFSRDVTERRQRQRQLRRKNERLDELASVLSHDLRNPLNAAKLRLDLAQDECENEHIDSAVTAIDRSIDRVEKLLTLAREGERISDVESVPLKETVVACWENTGTATATLECTTDQTVRADRDRLRQLLENLMRNSLEHAGEDITVRVRPLDDGDGFYLADDGPGIPEEKRDAVFDIGHSTTEGGTGFGLNIVAEIADGHGWDIDVTDSESGGARFDVSGVDTVE